MVGDELRKVLQLDRIEVGGVVDNLCHSITGERTAFQFKHDESTISIHRQQIEVAATSHRCLTADELQASLQHIGAPDKDVFELFFCFRTIDGR